MSRITRDIDEERELANGNIAVGIVIAAVFIAIALVVESGVSGLSVGINKAIDVGLFSADGMLANGSALVQLILCIVLAIAAIYLALTILERLTMNVREFEELKKGNIAVALEMAGAGDRCRHIRCPHSACCSNGDKHRPDTGAEPA
jgi:uncharacterized membrane protein YjfL (UPF0719 family)